MTKLNVNEEMLLRMYNCLNWYQYIDVQFLLNYDVQIIKVESYFLRNVLWKVYLYIHGPKEKEKEMRELKIRLKECGIYSKVYVD